VILEVELLQRLTFRRMELVRLARGEIVAQRYFSVARKVRDRDPPQRLPLVSIRAGGNPLAGAENSPVLVLSVECPPVVRMRTPEEPVPYFMRHRPHESQRIVTIRILTGDARTQGRIETPRESHFDPLSVRQKRGLVPE
jgi:hypothetical protein